MTKKEMLENLFGVEKPTIGMIHLAGETREEIIKRTFEELEIYQDEGVNGAIIEDYHGTTEDMIKVLGRISEKDYEIIIGTNVLQNPYSCFPFTRFFGGKFVQLDSVQTQDLGLDLKHYENLRIAYQDIFVFGGVGFKYKDPTGNPLEIDLEAAKSRCDAIVTTGEGTGVETPIEKLREYRETLDTLGFEDFPLIIGAGVNPDNAYEQLMIADGVITGSAFKPNGNTELPVDRSKVKSLMDIVREIRKIP